MASKKDVTTAAEAESNTQMAVYDYSRYDSGFENQTRDDYSIPFLAVLQGLSPQVEELEGAKPGMIINTVTNDLYSREGIVFVPAWTEHVFVEWKPRDEGGGFVGVHAVDSDVVRRAKEASSQFGKLKMPDDSGNDLIETFYVYGLRIDDASGAPEQAVLAFSSTKIKKYKAWMTKAKMIQVDIGGGRRMQAPLPAHRYRLRTVKEKNTKGEFWNWDVAFANGDAASSRMPPNDPIFQEATDIAKLIKSGAARANHESQNGAGSDDSDDGARAANREAAKGDADAPF